MRYRKLGQSDLKVSVLGFGAWQMGDDEYWGADDEADAEATVLTAIDNGINFFDTAEMYGRGASEEMLGNVLGRRRNKVLIATKFWVDKITPIDIRAACEASLRRLNTDHIDLYQVHWPLPHHSTDDAAETLLKLRDEGKIRYIGLSNFGEQDIGRWFNHGEAVSNQLGYNLLFRPIENDILKACKKNRLGVLAYMPLMQGLLSGRYTKADEVPTSRARTRHFSSEREGTRHGERGAEELTFSTLRAIESIANQAGLGMATLSLAWVMAQRGVSSALVGGRKPAQLERNLNAEKVRLTADVLTALDDATQELKNHFGNNADMWDGEAHKRVH